MPKYLSIIILCCLFPISCTNEKAALIQSFDSLYQQVLAENHEAVYYLCNEESQRFIEQMSDLDNHNPESLYEIAKEYKTPYTCLLLMLHKIKGEYQSPQDLFFHFLHSNQISFFDFNTAYSTLESKTKSGEVNYVAITKIVEGRKKLDYARFEMDDTGKYLYDLIYTIQLNEPKIKNHFKEILSAIQKEENNYDIKELFFRTYETEVSFLSKDAISKSLATLSQKIKQ